MRRFERLARWGGGTYQPRRQRTLQHVGLVQVAMQNFTQDQAEAKGLPEAR